MNKTKKFSKRKRKIIMNCRNKKETFESIADSDQLKMNVLIMKSVKT